MTSQKGNIVIIILVVVALISPATLGYFYLQSAQPKTAQITPPITPLPTQPTEKNTTWKTYTNNYWKISFQYPDDKLTPCFNYTTEKEGLRLFNYGFPCLPGDALYKIGFIGYGIKEYPEYKKPISTESITIDNQPAVKKIYQFDKSDGPFQSVEEEIEIVINTYRNVLVFQLFSNTDEDKILFSQILSTFKFLK